jgi:hypothetical protein
LRAEPTFRSASATSAFDQLGYGAKQGFASIAAFSRLQIADLISRIASRTWLILHLGGKG